MWTYEIPPVDACWELLPSVADIAAKLARADAEELSGKGNCGFPSCEEFLDHWVKAKILAESAGWEGDFSKGPVVLWFPNGWRFDYGFAFKHSNNGDTYVVSPVELPYLKTA